MSNFSWDCGFRQVHLADLEEKLKKEEAERAARIRQAQKEAEAEPKIVELTDEEAAELEKVGTKPRVGILQGTSQF